MNNNNLIIYNFPTLYEVLSELENIFNFNVIKLNKEDLKKFDKKNTIILFF